MINRYHAKSWKYKPGKLLTGSDNICLLRSEILEEVPNFLASIHADAGCQLCSLAGQPMTSHRLGDLSCPQLSPADRSYMESLQDASSKSGEKTQRHNHDKVRIVLHPHSFPINRTFPILFLVSLLILNIFIVVPHISFPLLWLQKRLLLFNCCKILIY